MKRILIVVLLPLFITSIPTYAINGPIEIKSPNIYGEFLWTKEYVDNITAEGIIDYSDILLPRRPIRRGEFIKWLVKAKELRLVDTGYEFSDVPKNHPLHTYIVTAAVNEIIEKEKEFHPNDALLRYQMGMWLITAKGKDACEEAKKYMEEPLVLAQDGYYELKEISPEVAGKLSVCYLPKNQLMYYRKNGDFRCIMPKETAVLGEACHSLWMLRHPPKEEKEIIIGLPQEPRTLFYNADSMTAMTQVAGLIYSTTVEGYDENWCIYPSLIKVIPTLENKLWKVYANGTMEVTYELRRGLKWADGKPITSQDLKFAFCLFNHPAFPIVHTQIDRWIKLEIVDNYTVKIKWDHPYLYANYGISIMPKHYWNYDLEYDLNDPNYYVEDDPNTPEDETYKSDQYKKDEEFIVEAVMSEYKERPLHAGPYKVKEWNKGQYIKLERNENFMLDKPLAKEITFKIIESTDSLFNAAKEGYIDVVTFGLTYDQALELEKYSRKKENISSLISIFVPALTWEHIDLNVDNEILSDKNVRKALIYSIDRQGIVNKFFNGKQPVSHSWLPSRHPAYDNSTITKYEYNLQKADKLLNEAGWTLDPYTGLREKDGETLLITFKTTSYNKTREDIQKEIKAYWEKVGIKVEVKNETTTTFFISTLQLREFSGPTACMYAWVMGPSSNLYSLLHSSQIPNDKNGYTGQNYTGYSNKEVDRLLDENYESLDKDKINKNLRKIQEIVTDELPSIPLYDRVDCCAINRKLKNFLPTGTTTAITWNGYLWYFEEQNNR